MSTKRVFRAEDIKKKSEDYHGGARFERAYPNIAEPEVGAKGVKAVNLELTFEALKLSLALSSCLHELNRYHRGTKTGREMGLVLSVKMDNSSIAVIEERIKLSE